ncbi:ABC-type cobalamin/Fe3+-siderophores transport system ATPase subunit [Stenotrophomonas sp. 2619]|uniref:ATP-dependent nuclease n=1 Tax=Stenotrophomonas sp. 2619 TaxID=3156316 RepID=UPI00339A6CC9
MPSKIIIENLRHIKRLEFEIPSQGLWLLTGANGTGKTSLLGCIRRIGFSNSFPLHFPASKKSDRLDSYEGATISYETPGGDVSYTYRTERWVPTPKKNSKVLSLLPYPNVLYIAANADRIEPSQEDFSPRRVRAAPQGIIDAANRIFCTDKFDALKTINVRRGVGSQAFLIELPDVGGKKQYFSEKNLSLGELCIIKLLRMLQDCPDNSLLLIDELELALHPTAQAELLSHLGEIAGSKSLTVIVSTHSSTLIKQASRDSLLFLQETEDGVVQCTRGCFPSYVLGALAYREEAASDILIYVEDESARIVVEQLVRHAMTRLYADGSICPGVSAVPVGGVANVLRFFVRQTPLLPAITKAYMVLDADAQQSIADARVEEIVRIAAEQAANISYLPYTPELGLVEYLHGNRTEALMKLRQHFVLNTLSLRAQDIPLVPDDAAKPRKVAKGIVDKVCDLLAQQLPNASSSDVEVALLKLLADHTFRNSMPRVMQQFGPILRG